MSKSTAQSDAERQRRHRAHVRGDHTGCSPGRCRERRPAPLWPEPSFDVDPGEALPVEPDPLWLAEFDRQLAADRPAPPWIGGESP